jgi:hypothetical protein
MAVVPTCRQATQAKSELLTARPYGTIPQAKVALVRMLSRRAPLLPRWSRPSGGWCVATDRGRWPCPSHPVVVRYSHAT